MGEQIRKTGNEALDRWQQKMPKFFRLIMRVCICIASTATAIHVYFTHFGIQPHEWWNDVLPYLTGIPLGMALMAKFTVDGGYRDKTIESISKNTILDKDDN